eukprot:gene9017-9189_t
MGPRWTATNTRQPHGSRMQELLRSRSWQPGQSGQPDGGCRSLQKCPLKVILGRYLMSEAQAGVVWWVDSCWRHCLGVAAQQ